LAADRARWWGWGEPPAGSALPLGAEALLREDMGLDVSVRTPAVSLEEVNLPDSALPTSAREALVRVVGEEGVREDRPERVLRAAGKSYPDLLRQRTGDCSTAPDAVVAPRTAAEVAAVLDVCAAAGVAVVPFGGGTSVVGGVEPLRGACGSVISLDLEHLDRIAAVDTRSLTARIESGLRLPAAEAALNAQGLTLGHFPQSYEFATVGGCVATRSAGQASTGYGRIEDMVVGVHCVAPAGALDLLAVPATAAGPDLRELVVGSEGAFGVITETELRVRPVPEARRYEGFFFRSFAEGSEAFRALAQEGATPDVARLSDESETRVSLAMAGRHGVKARMGEALLRRRGYADGCVAICGWEGSAKEVGRRRARTARALRAHGAMAVGQSPGRAWVRGRYAAPYLRDELLDRGVLVETLETAATWSALPGLYAGVSDALRGALTADGDPALIMCHVSHLYRPGASLYFTFFTRAHPGAELEQWRRAKTAASDAILAAGGTITHHHAIGHDHVPWLAREVGETGVSALRALKDQLDPAGVMNPGKLIA
jgi:alkyldihydroxyacetonephosphate synthase